MREKIDEILTKFTTDNFRLIEETLNALKTDRSEIIEIIGEQGSGKFYILRQLMKALQNTNLDVYIPHIFKFNQFREIIGLFTDISGDKLDEFIKQSKELKISRKYDLFYFLTEKLKKEKLVSEKNIIIYENSFLDQYTRDFIQYFIQAFPETKIKIIIFTDDETFVYSHKITIEPLSKDNINAILSAVLSSENNYETEAALIFNISKGNLFIVRDILINLMNEKNKLDIDSFINKKINAEFIYNKNIGKLKESEKQLLFTVFLLDGRADKKTLEKILKSKSLEKDLQSLSEKEIIFEIKKIYYAKKGFCVKNIFDTLSDAEKQKLIMPIIAAFKDDITADYCFRLHECNDKQINSLIDHISLLNDYETLKTIYQKKLERTSDSSETAELHKQIGNAYFRLNETDSAVEHFREALNIALHNALPAHEYIYYFAKSLFEINSSTMALEVIKKYSPQTIDTYWKWKILILKIEILTDIEQFEEALKVAEEVFRITPAVEDSKERALMRAICKKSKGLIYYYQNNWNKSESEFLEAETLFLDADNAKGLAAIYNNLGSLAMLQGKWSKSETLFLKSLEYEKKRYSLKGISGCYSNLGYLFEGKGDYQKSLYYLNEALKIQKLLDNREVITKIYNNIGVTYMDNGEYDKAADAINQLLEISIKFNTFRSIVAAYNNLGAVYFKSGDWTQAIHYYEKAISKSKETNFYEGLCQSYNNLGELYEKRGEFELAYEFYTKSLDLQSKTSDDFLKAEIYGNIGSVLTALHKFGEAYRYLVESLDFFKSIDVKDKIMEGSQKIAFYFLQSRNYESASYYLDTSLKMAEEIGDDYQAGKTYFLKALLERTNHEKARQYLKIAIEKFVSTKNNFELAQANYELAQILYEEKKWEQALQILNENKKIIKKFGAIKFLEKNDILIQKINKEYAVELKESKHQESLLNQFYEITQNLNNITDFDILLETALDNLVEFSEADGGIFCLYNNQLVKDYWEYINLKGISNEDENFNNIMDIILKTYKENKQQNFKQPYFAPEYNHVISFPLSVRNDKKGVICLFSKHGTHYFTEKMTNLISALCNQIIVIVENISYSSLQKHHEIIREELAAKSSFTNIIGKSEKIQQIFRIIEKIKDTPTTILLEGPSGTGKELIARAIHYNSNRRNKKFVAQYCGALPETLLESELFGHVKGSFTGAIHDKKGLFELADGGTFFLDEIADISLSTQAKLLRFLQEGEIKKVGSTKTQKVDVRVICATNVSLKEKVEKGEFRLDLYYRLNVIKIDVPALKERKSDIPLLAIHFLDKYSKKIGKKVNGITDEAMKYLVNYDWPGNIRQLENEIERAVTLADNDSYIKSSDLSEEIFRFQEISNTISLLENTYLKDAVEELEKEMILKVLEKTNWNQTQTAKQLGLSRQGLIKKMHRYKLEK